MHLNVHLLLCCPAQKRKQKGTYFRLPAVFFSGHLWLEMGSKKMGSPAGRSCSCPASSASSQLCTHSQSTTEGKECMLEAGHPKEIPCRLHPAGENSGGKGCRRIIPVPTDLPFSSRFLSATLGMCIVLSTHAVASNSASILVMKCHFRETLKLAPVESFHVLRKCIDVNAVLKSTTEDYKAKELGSQTDMQNVNPFRTAMQLRKRLNKKNCKILRQIIADKVNIVILVLVRIRVEETPRRIFKFPLLF